MSLLDQATRRPLQLPHIMAGVAMTAALAVPTTVAAQSDMSPSPPPPITTEEAKIALPDPEGCRLEISNEGLDAQQRQNLGAMLIDTIGEDHFFGAIYAYLPEGSKQLSIHLRRKLHSPEAAERSALKDCEAERSEGDSECYRIGRIVPENWHEENALLLSHEAMFAFSQNVDQMNGPKVLARSRDTTAWAMWSGASVRQDALDECNEAVDAAGLEPDCDIVIEDAP